MRGSINASKSVGVRPMPEFDAPLGVPLSGVAALLDERGALTLAPGEVQVWAVDDEIDAATRARCAALLSDDERTRLARFRFDANQREYAVSHAITRALLGRYLARDPQSLQFTFGASGKPESVGLSFNLSHSHGRVLLAVGEGAALGADVERERDNVDVLGIAGSYFFGAELEAVQAAGDAGVRSAFFRHWVAKEAVLKGVGLGLGFPLERFGVHFSTGLGFATLTTLAPEQVAPDWTIRMLTLGDACPAAVTRRGADWRVRAMSVG